LAGLRAFAETKRADRISGLKGSTVRKMNFFVFLLLLHCTLISCSKTSEGPSDSGLDASGVIEADDPHIRYIGRFSFDNPKKVLFDWPVVGIFARFEGTSCSVRIKDGKNLYAVTVDGRTPFVLPTDTGTVYRVAENLEDSLAHWVLIRKRTEAFVGKGEFLGFILDKGRRLLGPDPRPDRRIEVIGNSVTCGYGVEGASASCRFSNETEDASKSYAALIAEELGADYNLVAYSGKGVVRNYGDAEKTSPDPMPALYGRTCSFDPALKWDPAKWIPQAVIINLGTNDFSTQPHPDKAFFQDAYTRLIERVKGQYAGVKIFCLCGPMIGEPCLSYIREVVEQFSYTGTASDVHFIPIQQSLLTSADRGCDWHPNVKGQKKIAGVIVPVVRDVMNW
jgi:lysophospholipase L1-like esterase